MNKRKTTIIILLILLLLVGGAGGYLLWRVNQKDTVAPTDSDAGKVKEGECLQREVTVTLYPYKSKEGDLEYNKYRSEPITAHEDVENNNLEVKFKDSCVPPVTITARPKEGYKFVRWDDAVRKRSSMEASITIRYKDYTDGSVNKLRAVYEKADSDTETISLTYEASCGTKGVRDLLTCFDPSLGVIRAETNCLNQKIKVGSTGAPVYITDPKDEECVFQHWEVDGKKIGTEVPHRAKFEKDTTIKAIFERRYKGKNFSLKYSSKKEGDLKVDGSLVKAYPVTIQFTDGQPYPDVPEVEAVPKEGWEFDAWESNIRSLTSISDRTKNPRHDVDRKVDLDIIAVYKKKEEEKPDPEIPPKTPETPPSSEKKDTTEEKMPQTSAFSDRSLYVITVGVLVLCLGMIWQYIPKDIFKRFRK